MTTTNTPKLTGPNLIEVVEANLETHDVNELAALTGYDKLGEWADALKKAKDEEAELVAEQVKKIKVLCSTLDIEPKEAAEKNNENSVLSMVQTIGGLTYRWLTYQYALDNGFEDDVLAEQQIEFAADIIHKAKLLRVVLGTTTGMLITDTVLVQTYLIAYVRAGGWKIEGERGKMFTSDTREQWQENFDTLVEWGMDQDLIQEMLAIGAVGLDQETVDDYKKQQDPRCNTIATYLRTQILDYVNGTNHCSSEKYKRNLGDANLYTHYVNKNCSWTYDALVGVIWACIKYDFRDYNNNEDKDVICFGMNTLNEMMSSGEAVAAEIQVQ